MSTMSSRKLRRRIIPLVVALACFPGAVDTKAGDDTGWRLRVDFGFFDLGGDGITVDTGTNTFRTEVQAGGGAGVRGEYQPLRWLGVEFGFFSGATVDVDFDFSGGSGSTRVDVSSFVPFTVGLDIHLTPRSRVDLYIGPQLAWVRFNNVQVSVGSATTGGSISVDSDVGPGAILGLDIPLGASRRWAFQMNLRYFKTTMEGGNNGDSLKADFEPTIFSLGFGYRF
jgi:outer membrane protein W